LIALVKRQNRVDEGLATDCEARVGKNSFRAMKSGGDELGKRGHTCLRTDFTTVPVTGKMQMISRGTRQQFMPLRKSLCWHAGRPVPRYASCREQVKGVNPARRKIGQRTDCPEARIAKYLPRESILHPR
jgi:hypothetical protein